MAPAVTQILILASLLPAPWGFLPKASPIQTAKPGSQAVPHDTLITLERTGCYGMCPIYKVSISSDGTVVFEGNRFVKNIGTARSKISQGQISELLIMFEKINYFELSNQYAQPEDGCKEWLTDHPSAITTITTSGKSKSVTHYYGCRGLEVLKELEKLEQAIDNAVNSAQWIR